jgi:putative aminopeptidase FrvX
VSRPSSANSVAFLRMLLSLCLGLSLLLGEEASAQAQSKDRVARLLEELANAPGPSGFEGAVREILTREMRAAGLEVSTDGLGSVIGALGGAADAPRVMLAAHMDEVGAVVRYVTPEGMVKFQMLGGWLDQALVDQRWSILTNKGPVTAVSGLRSVHITQQDERAKVTPRDELFLDVGARSKQEAEAMGVGVGDPIVPASPFAELGKGRYVSKALDDRVGCVMLLETLRRLKEQGQKIPGTIYFVGTVQEEVGLRGARTAVDVAKPHVGISLEAGIAADHPGGKADQAQQRLGAGPTINLADSSMLANLKLRDFFSRVANENNIPLQIEVTSYGGQDGAEMQRYGAGRPSINFSVPTRYLHGHNSVIDRADLDRAIDLLVAILLRLDAKTVEEIARF